MKLETLVNELIETESDKLSEFASIHSLQSANFVTRCKMDALRIHLRCTVGKLAADHSAYNFPDWMRERIVMMAINRKENEK